MLPITRRDNPVAGPGDIVGAVVLSLSAGQLRALRLRAQLLSGPTAMPVAAVAAQLAGLQAQAAPPARLAVRARAAGGTAADADRACDTGEVIRTWAMRGTLHMVAGRDVRWMNSLFGPVFAAKGRRRRVQLGLDDARCERALTALAVILAGSAPLTRAELVSRLAAEGIRIDPRTQQPPHLLGYAAHRGLICRGPDRAGEEPTYVLLDDWAPGTPALSHDDALTELIRRYLHGYGPACRDDFAAWSGLPAAQARRALDLIADDLVPIRAAAAQAGRTQLFTLNGDSREAPGDTPPRLLGHFDPYLLGYRDRSLMLDAQYARRIQTGGGFVQPVVLIGGQVAGTWRLTRRTAGAGRAARATLTVEPFTELPAASADGLAAEAEDIGRFLGADVTLEKVET